MKVSKRTREILMFCLGGGISVSVYYAILYLFTRYTSVWYPLASVIGSVVMYRISFQFQKHWTFKNKEKAKTRKQLTLYFSMAFGILLTNSIFLYVLVEYAHLKIFFAQFILTFILTIVSFLLTKTIFKNTSSA